MQKDNNEQDTILQDIMQFKSIKKLYFQIQQLEYYKTIYLSLMQSI